MATFQARHFNAIAETLHNTRRITPESELPGFDRAADVLAGLFSADNPRFKREAWDLAIKEGVFPR